jgi:hypothetical protein
MKKNFRSVKATLIMGILLVSLSAALVPTTSAGILFNLEHLVEVNYEDITGIVAPRGEWETITFNLTYKLVYGGLFPNLARLAAIIYAGRPIVVRIEPIESPDWVIASVDQSPQTSIQVDQPSDLQARLSIKVDEDAPAYGGGYVKLRITVPQIGGIGKFETEVDVKFDPGYLPIVQPQFPEGEYKLIGPMDTAVFPIEFINMGNARTRVYFEIVSISDEGWSAIITDEIVLDENEGSKETVWLTIKPPKSFGYHDRTAAIYIHYTPEMVEQPDYKGDTKPISLLVESRGFSVIGIEIIILPIIIIVVILLLLYQFVIKKRLRK